MFSMRERRKRKHKFGGTKVCKAEEVRKYFVNPKIENVSTIVYIKLFEIWISEIQKQSFADVLQNRCS